MKTGAIIALTFAGLTVCGAATIASSYVSAHNTAVSFESNIKMFHKESQNTLSNYTLKIKEMAQVPDKYAGALKEMIQETFQGRYGEDGSKAAFQWIQERNMDFDSSMYVKLQATMEAGRNEFRLSQTKKLDICAKYEQATKFFWQGTMMRMAGYPSNDFVKSDFCEIIIDASTSHQFETGVATAIEL